MDRQTEIMSAHILGDPETQKLGHPIEYFVGRDCWIDCRVKDMLDIHPEANFGWNVTIISETHDVMPGMFGRTFGRPCRIGPHAFIAAFALLYNCTIGEGAVVACGSVVRSCDVEPWTMVAGNPAVPIKRFNHATKNWEAI